ncbi:hypothetical protein PbJCM13498_37910 [Prolixibacter bellariivorans]|uniref:Uncharacterized protein n=1 Tax=Prolixibacter bellariivorans TaxID=314319 RepID=A0A5M4B504_9BACT|nr:hypothetical protein [Prolixibacter bellariivorans]GET34928.1 hypothetical protein PbJCM13498_37910 [Prolixibacter bellariivorans]
MKIQRVTPRELLFFLAGVLIVFLLVVAWEWNDIKDVVSGKGTTDIENIHFRE